MAFRDIFRRKTHKEKYEESEKVVKETKKVAEAAHQEYKIRKEKGKIFFRLPNEPIGLISDGLHRPYEEARAYATQEWYDSAKRRLEKLYAKGLNEAHKLNKRYDALIVATKNASRALNENKNTKRSYSLARICDKAYTKL